MSQQFRAGHFFPSLNGNLPGEDLNHHLYGDFPIFNTNQRGLAGRLNAISHDPANLAMEDVQWDKSTYVLPKVLPPTAPSELRARVLALTLKTLKRSTRGDDATKAALLEQRFQCASAATRARTAASPAKNILGGAYTFSDPLIKRSTGTVLNIGDPPTEADRRNAKFIEFRATFRPLTIDPNLANNPKSFVAAVRLPLDEATQMVSATLATREEWLNARVVITRILQLTASLPELTELGELQNGRLQLKESAVSNKLTALYDKVYLELLQKEIEKDYVGDAIHNAQSVVQNTRQVRFVGGRQVCDPIEVYLKRFSSALDLLDEDNPYPIDIVSTCHQNMSEITKRQIKSLGWTEPARAATNAGQHEQLSRLRTIAVRAEEAITTTRLVSGTRRSTHLGNTNSAFTAAPIFTTTLDDENDDGTMLPPLPEVRVARPDGPPPDFDGTVATGVSTLAADRTFVPNSQVLLNQPMPQAMLHQPVPQSTLLEEAREYKIFLSNSEIAMRTAAGEENKLCWGGCYKFFPEDTDGRHTYAACPFRRVDRVREHALPFLRRFRQQNGPLNRKVSSLLADPDKLTAAFCNPTTASGGISQDELNDLQTNWQSKGFTSEEMAKSVCLLADPNTSKRTREVELSALKNKIVRNNTNKKRREQDKADLKSYRSQASVATTNTNMGWNAGQFNTNYYGDSNRKNNGNNPFILVTLPIFSTEVDEGHMEPPQKPPVNVPSLLRMSQALPHIDIPVGIDKPGVLVLRAVFDSGAGLNVGRRSYHDNVRKSYPQLISNYIDLEEGNYDTPAIGGVDGNAYGSAVTSLITYRTPFQFNGQPVGLTFGLVEGLCAKSIIGITTMQKARMNYLVAPQVVTSEVFNHTFQVTMQKPSTDDVPPTPVPGNAAVLQARSQQGE